MDTRPKVLILHASAGHGHEKAARAVEQALLDILPRERVRLEDALPLTPGFFGHGYRKGYLFMIQHLAWLWGMFYYLTDNPLVYFFVRPLRRAVNGCMGKRLVELILSEKPDVIVSTHFLSVEVVSALKKKGLVRCRFVTVVTDYLAHSFWLGSGVDLYAVGSQETKADLEHRGVPASKIAVTGIPVEKKFTQALSKSAARTKLGLGDAKFTALLTSGGAGVGSLQALVKDFLGSGKPVELLVVCGTNKSLLARMETMVAGDSRVRLFGFVDNIQELMAASDLVIGKGGGLTVSESLCTGKPLVLFGSVPGQETKNADSMTRLGAAKVARSLPDVVRLTVEMMNSPALLKEYAAAAARLGHPQAASDIAKEVLRV